MHLRMFNRFTNSNAESEHAALKKKSLGLQANGSLHNLYRLSEMDAKRRHYIKQQSEHSNLTTTDVKSLCPLSSYLTNPCFDELQNKILLAQQCISKQLSTSEWLVIYQRKDPFEVNEVNSFLPYIKQIRKVTKNIDGHLFCSCKHYELYGYPCHHLFHVLKCYNIHDIKREWIHIRWTNVYSRYHYSTDIKPTQRKIYEELYDNFPAGPKYIANTPTTSYPIYDGFKNGKIAKDLFDMPQYQIVSRSNFSKKWIHVNNSSDPELKKLLTYKNDSLYDAVLFSSQTNMTFSQPIEEKNSDFSLQGSNDDDISDTSDCLIATSTTTIYPENFNYSTHNVVLKRAVDLCGSNVESHKKLYDCLTEFVHSKEINHVDNHSLIKKHHHDYINNNQDTNKPVTVISSNKVVNSNKPSTKRSKSKF